MLKRENWFCIYHACSPTQKRWFGIAPTKIFMPFLSLLTKICILSALCDKLANVQMYVAKSKIAMHWPFTHKGFILDQPAV